MRRMQRGFMICLLLLAGTGLFAQQYGIEAGNVTACSGVLQDTGGPMGPYGNNENHTAVICPDQPGDGISLNWVIFDLSLVGPNPPDRIRIWDGSTTADGFLGEYTGTSLQGLVVSATTFNPTGCLTVQFISNGAGIGDFAASISCFTPCDRPEAVATMSEAVPAMICQGESVNFDGTASFAAPGFNIVQYTWNFDDGTTADGPTATHAFTEPGEYIVQLNLIDDNDCVNNNVVDLQVLVSTTPTFHSSIASTTSCIGATLELTANVTPTTWTGIPESNFGGALFLPDDVGQPFSNDLNFTQFEPGQTLQNVNDLGSICVSMEHSYMGDLVLSLTCPNGQSMILHQQGGGSTYLGGAYDLDNNANPVPGDCWDYCWAPTATNGTWVQAAAAGMTMLAGTPASQALLPGTYNSVQPFSNMVGCPLNGTWSFTSVDLWAADNGHICSWSINFNPAIIPDITQFTPDLGTTSHDSTTWTGPVTVDPDNPLHGYAQFDAPGTYEIALEVVDNFGCAYDTSITVVVNEPYQVEAGPTIALCDEDPVFMAGQMTFDPTPGIAPLYAWSPPEGLINYASPTSSVYVEEATMYYLSVYPPGFPECAAVDSVLVTPDLPIDAGEDASLTLCASQQAFQLTDSLGGTPDAGGQWSLNGAPVPTLFDPSTGTAGTYLHTITSANNCIDTAELEITLIPTEDPVCCGIATAGSDSMSCDMTNALHASPGNTGMGKWSGPANAIYTNIFSPNTLVTLPPGMGGTHTFYWIENDSNFCYLIDSVQMTFTDEIVIEFEQIDASCYSYCDGSASATVTGGNVASEFSYMWSIGTGVTTPSVTDLCAGQATLTVVDDNGCGVTKAVSIGHPWQVQIDQITYEPVTCTGECDGQIIVTDATAVEYSFNNGASWGTSPVSDQACEGLHLIRIRDDGGCVGSGSVVVTGPPPVMADFQWAPDNPNVDAPHVQFVNTSLNATTYSWDIAGLKETDEEDPQFTFSEIDPAFYEICLTAYNANLCPNEICKTVEIEDILLIYIPSGFTPNGDGINDVFKLSVNIDAITNFHLMVFDRWGRVVFETTDPDQGWNGGHGGSDDPLANEVFVYRLSYDVLGDDNRKELMGTLTLAR